MLLGVHMSDDIDRNLMRAFAEEAMPLADDGFIRGVMFRVARRRRRQVVLRVVGVVSLLLMGGFATRALVRVSLVAGERFGELMVSPVGWILSMLVAVVLLRRWRVLQR